MSLPVEDLHIEALRAAYGAGRLRPTELVRVLHARIEQDGLEGEWTHLVSLGELLSAAAELESRAQPGTLPLYGIPFGVKDNIDVRGMPTTAACPAYGYVPDRSSPTVASLIEAGALCFGKLNLDQFATGLVGSRSPYGVAHNVFDADYLAGGSSSGSALAVATHHVSFSLGTDTAGSGRVPPALNNLVGMKPTVGRWSTAGTVPACASLDCIAVFALNVPDAIAVRDVIESSAGRPPVPLPGRFRFGIPEPLELFGDPHAAEVFERCVSRLVALGGSPVKINYSPFSALGDLLYGPFVWERYLAVGSFIETHLDAVLPVTGDIILGAKQHSAADLMIAVQLQRKLRGECLRELREVDLLVLPTVPAPPRVDEDARDPRTTNDRLGYYTRFVNFVGSPVLNVPQDFRPDGLPSSVSLVALPWADHSLDAFGEALHARSDAGMGKRRTPLANAVPQRHSSAPARATLAVVGAHMRGMPLNEQLQRLHASFIATARTASDYRLYLLPGGPPHRPGMVRVSQGGAAVAIELWELSWQALGELLALVPAPLAIGRVELADGSWVQGFVCEASATEGAEDITTYGGYRAYVGNK